MLGLGLPGGGGGRKSLISGELLFLKRLRVGLFCCSGLYASSRT